MDGSSEMKIFFRICLPQVKAGIAATAVFGLILTWNEFLFARAAHRARHANGAGRHGADHRRRHRRPLGPARGDRDAVPDPVVFVTFLLQNQLLRGVTFGTIKR